MMSFYDCCTYKLMHMYWGFWGVLCMGGAGGGGGREVLLVGLV